MSQGPAGSTRTGFQGAIGSLPLVDLLQVWGANSFSGLVRVTSQERTGHLYFVDGEIVHAEYDGGDGEAAVRAIVSWSDGSFDLHPNTTTMHRTIEKRLSHLLLEAHRLIDEERRAAMATAAPPRPSPQARPAAPAAPAAREPGRLVVLDQIRAIPGVIRLVRFAGDGRTAADAGPEGEALAAKGLYLAMAHAGAVAQAFGLHDLSVATLRGARESFVLVHSHGQYLCVAVAAEVPIDPVAGQIRALLTRPAARPQ